MHRFFPINLNPLQFCERNQYFSFLKKENATIEYEHADKIEAKSRANLMRTTTEKKVMAVSFHDNNECMYVCVFFFLKCYISCKYVRIVCRGKCFSSSISTIGNGQRLERKLATI